MGSALLSKVDSESPLSVSFLESLGSAEEEMDPDQRSKIFMELQRRLSRTSLGQGRPSRPPPPPPRRLTTTLSTSSTFDSSSLMTSANASQTRARSQSVTEESNQDKGTSKTDGTLSFVYFLLTFIKQWLPYFVYLCEQVFLNFVFNIRLTMFIYNL